MLSSIVLSKPETASTTQAELAAIGVGLSDLISLENNVVRRMHAECARRIRVGHRSQDGVVGDVPGPAVDLDRAPLKRRARDRPAVGEVGRDQIDVLFADILIRRVALLRQQGLEARIG